MEPETLFTKQDDSCKTAVSVETRVGDRNIEEKLKEKSLVIDVVAVEGSQQPVIVHEPVVPDLTLFSYEVQQGYRIFRELLSDQYRSFTYPFISPVDVEGLNLWDYHARIETPMSFSQIEDKFKSYLYQSVTEVISDMRLILENCYRYNGSTHWISKLAHKLEKIIDQKLALLNRSLREKVTLRATMAFRNKNVVEEIAVEEPVSVGRPRRSGRTSYVNGMNPEESSSLMNHLLLEEEENQREIKRLKEKEKKEANEALMQELSEWEGKVFPSNVLKDLRSMWEIPAIGSFLWLFQPALNLPELNFTEFEHSFILPHKSQQMAWIFTSLLVTPSQRKNLLKRSPMKFRVWERKLKERMDVWYLAKQDDELQMVARQIGLDPTFFEILGETNPLDVKSYVDLTLHQRVLILKVLCDECLDYHPQLRDFLGTTDATSYSETYLGYDGQNATYLYFPIFDATDIRVYKQAELRPLNEWYRKWTSKSKTVSGSYQTPKRTNQSRSRRSSTPKSARKSKGPSTTIEPGFELVCNDVESLRILCEKFAEPPTMPSRRKSGSRPTRKRSEKELHKVLTDLVEDLGKSDPRYARGRVKGLLNLMKDWKKSVEEISYSGDEFNDQDGEIEEGAGDFLQPTLDNEVTTVFDNTNTETIPGEAAPLLSIVTRSRNRKRKFPDYDDITSTSSSPVSEISKNFESEFGRFDDSPDSRVERRSDKHRTLENDVVQDSIMGSTEMCDVILRDVIDDVISKVSASENTEVVMNGIDSDGQITTTVTQNGSEKHSVDTMDIISNGQDVEKNEDHHGVSVDNKEHQPMETSGKNSHTDDNRDTAMDIDGFENRQNHATLKDKISNGSSPITNGNEKEHKEENMDVYTRTIDGSSSEQKSSKHCAGQNCPGTQEINGGITGTQRTHVYNNGQCGEPSNDICDGDPLKGGHNPRTNIPTGVIPTGIIPTGNGPTGIVLPTGKEPTGIISTGIKSTVNVPEEKDHVPSTGIRNQSPIDTVTT